MTTKLLKNILTAVPPSKGKSQVFVTIAPGLENSMIKEFTSILDTSRTMESARMRVGSKFVAGNFKQLQSGLEKLPWDDYISNSEKFPNVRVTCLKSKLYHTGAIQERVKETIAKMRKNTAGWGKREKPSVTGADVHVRLINDITQASVDVTSNEHYRRTGDKHVTDAPLRETIAASLLNLANYKPGGYLWDPFMGSGTFLNEALSITSGGPIAPLNSKSFPMETWPSFDRERYNALLDMLPKSQKINELNVFGCDISKKALDATTHNLAQFKLPESFQHSNLFLGDFEAFEKSIPTDKDVMVMTKIKDVPYGHRIGENQKELQDTFKRFVAMLRRRTDLRRVFVLAASTASAPAHAQTSPASPASSPARGKMSAAKMLRDACPQCEWVLRAKFDNRGIPVEFLQLKR